MGFNEKSNMFSHAEWKFIKKTTWENNINVHDMTLLSLNPLSG